MNVSRGSIPTLARLVAAAMVCACFVPGLVSRCSAQAGQSRLNLEPQVDSSSRIPEEQEGVDVVERLGEYLPLELPFTDSTGETVTLADAFPGDRPVIIAMVYYDCPIVCGVVMGKLTESFKGIDFDLGDEYNVVFASIDPSETPALAASVKDRYLAMYDRAGTRAEGWKFLTSTGDSARVLAERIGWAYKPLPDGEYSHPVAIVVLTPEGRIARYVYGIGYEPDTMRMALLEASDGQISESIGDMVRMFCFRYDPTTGKYSLAAFRVVQLGGVLAIVGVGSLIGVLLINERVRRRRLAAEGRTGEDVVVSPSHAKQVSGSKA